MLEIGGGNDDGVDLVGVVQFLIIPVRLDRMPGLFLDIGDALFPPPVPDIRNAGDLEVHAFVIGKKGRDQSAPHAVGKTDDAYPHLVIGAKDACVASGAHSHSDAGGAEARPFDELTSGWFCFFHEKRFY